MSEPIAMRPDAVRAVAASVRPAAQELGALRAAVDRLRMTPAQFGPIAARTGSAERYNAVVDAMSAAVAAAATAGDALQERLTTAADRTGAADEHHASSIARVAASGR